MEEIFKSVYHEGVYTGKLISNFGRMIREDGSLCIPSDNGAGYMSVLVFNAGFKNHREYLHRLVAKYFIPNPQNLPQVNHKDCDKTNNHVDNLEWISRKGNIDHAHSMGRMKKRKENAEIDILSVNQVIELYVAVKRDKVGISEKARQMKLPRTTASSIMNKRSRSKITDRLDDYLERGGTCEDLFPTIHELGFSDKTKLVRTKERVSTNNTTGVTGIYRAVATGIHYFLVRWEDSMGKGRSKYFNIDKLGEEEAFIQACKYRESVTD